MDYNNVIDNKRIGDFLITKKNYYEYIKFGNYSIEGEKLIEVSYCSSHYEELEHYKIYCTFPYDRDCKLKPKIILNFNENIELFFEIRKELSEYKENNAFPTILVLGQFVNRECKIYSDKQIRYIKNPKY